MRTVKSEKYFEIAYLDEKSVRKWLEEKEGKEVSDSRVSNFYKNVLALIRTMHAIRRTGHSWFNLSLGFALALITITAAWLVGKYDVFGSLIP